jgi:hypothetical protein
MGNLTYAPALAFLEDVAVFHIGPVFVFHVLNLHPCVAGKAGFTLKQKQKHGGRGFRCQSTAI